MSGGDIQRYFGKPVVILVSPNPDDIRNYVEMRLARDAEPEAMSNELRAEIVRVFAEKLSDMWVEPFSIPTISMMYTYQGVYADSSLFRSTWTLF